MADNIKMWRSVEMKRKLSMVLALLLLVSSLAACSGGSGTKTPPVSSPAPAASGEPAGVEKELTLAYICKALDQDWYQSVQRELKSLAPSLGVKEIIFYDCQMNPDTYLTNLDNAISQKVDGIFVCPPDQNLSRVTLQKCQDAGIPVLADADPLVDENGKLIAPALQLDNYVVGSACGDWLGNHVKENHLMEDPSSTGLMLLTMDTVTTCVQRTAGEYDVFKAILPDFPDSNVFRGDSNGETAKGFDVMSATITANPQIKTWFVLGANEEITIGATRALEQAGLDKEAVVVGLGAYNAKDEFKKEYSAMKASAYFSAAQDAEAIATALVENIRTGKTIFGEYLKEGEDHATFPLGAIMVTRENYRDIMGSDAD